MELYKGKVLRASQVGELSPGWVTSISSAEPNIFWKSVTIYRQYLFVVRNGITKASSRLTRNH